MLEPLDEIEKFEELISKSKRVPLTSNIILNEGKVYEFLDRLRASFPEEFKEARWIVKERDQVLHDAKAESDRIISDAQEEANRLVSETKIIKNANRESERIIREAETKERELKLEAEDYIDSKLAGLEATLQKLLTSIEKGRQKLSRKEITLNEQETF